MLRNRPTELTDRHRPRAYRVVTRQYQSKYRIEKGYKLVIKELPAYLKDRRTHRND